MNLKHPEKIQNDLCNAVENMVHFAEGRRELVKIAISKKTCYLLYSHFFNYYNHFFKRDQGVGNELIGKLFQGCEFVIGYEKEVVIFMNDEIQEKIEPLKISIYE